MGGVKMMPLDILSCERLFFRILVIKKALPMAQSPQFFLMRFLDLNMPIFTLFVFSILEFSLCH